MPGIGIGSGQKNKNSGIFIQNIPAVSIQLGENALGVKGEFNNSNGWSIEGSNLTISGGKANFGAGMGDYGPFVAYNSVQANAFYQCDLEISNYVAGNVFANYSYGGSLGIGPLGGNGAKSGTNLSTDVHFLVQGYSTAQCSVDNVTMKAITLSSTLAKTLSLTKNIIAGISLVMPNENVQAGLMISIDSITSPLNFVLAYIDRKAGRLYMFKCVNGTYTQLISSAISYVAEAILEVRKNGNIYGAYYNGSKIGTDQTVNDISIVDNILASTFATNANCVASNLYARENT